MGACIFQHNAESLVTNPAGISLADRKYDSITDPGSLPEGAYLPGNKGAWLQKPPDY